MQMHLAEYNLIPFMEVRFTTADFPTIPAERLVSVMIIHVKKSKNINTGKIHDFRLIRIIYR